MNRWQALVEIVKSFNERGCTNLAFAIIIAFLVISPLTWLAASIFGTHQFFANRF